MLGIAEIQYQTELLRLIKKEKFEVIEEQIVLDGKIATQQKVLAHGQKFPLAHPYQIYLSLYHKEKDPVTKLGFMKHVHDILWPEYIETWNTWEEERFLAHCEGHTPIVLAAGASAGKSLTVAKIGLIFWLSYPFETAVVVASTTLESLENRIWGYVTKLAAATALPIPIKIYSGNRPKILHPQQKDRISGMFATAIQMGDDDKVIAKLIGRHPKYGVMVILDESTDMNPAITKAFPNLEKGVEVFQAWAIGNSKSRNDLHGSLATPKGGWEEVDPERDKVWPTTYPRGICLYNHPKHSPAIIEPDLEKRKRLGKFLITQEEIDLAKKTYGEKSDSYSRFILGYWPTVGIDNTIISEPFLMEHQAYKMCEWSGHYDLQVVAGLDPAFQVGGTGCLLRLGVMGHTAGGLIALDYRREELLFRINLQMDLDKSGELQLAQQVVEILQKYRCPVRNLAIDATGVGRALGELIRLISGEPDGPIRIVSSRVKTMGGKVDPHILVMSPSEMWMKLRDFVQYDQIRGVDGITLQQFSNRLIEIKNGKTTLETKADYKARMAARNPALAHSPDEADAAILALHAAIIRYGFSPGEERVNPTTRVAELWKEKQFAFELEQRQEHDKAVSRRVGITADFSAGLEELFKH